MKWLPWQRDVAKTLGYDAEVIDSVAKPRRRTKLDKIAEEMKQATQRLKEAGDEFQHAQQKLRFAERSTTKGPKTEAKVLPFEKRKDHE